MNEEKHDYADLCDCVSALMKRASDDGRLDIEDGGAAILSMLESLERVPAALEAVIVAALDMIGAKEEIERDGSLEYAQRVSGKVGRYRMFMRFMDVLTAGIHMAHPGALVVIAPNAVAFLVFLLVPFEEWEVGI